MQHIPPPQGDPDGPPRALIFDSVYDQYRGVVAFVRVRDGSFRKNDALAGHGHRAPQRDRRSGHFFARTCSRPTCSTPAKWATSSRASKRWPTCAWATRSPAPPARPPRPLPGYRDITPMVFCGLFPIERRGLPRPARRPREAQAQRCLSALSSRRRPKALGFGFRCGFLGLLHMEIVRERLEREFDLDLLATTPSVHYEVELVTGRGARHQQPGGLSPDSGSIKEVREPYIAATILVPAEYVGPVMELCNDKRGRFEHMEYLTTDRVRLDYALPLAEIVLDFFDLLKTKSRGYASLDYELKDYEPGDLVRLDIRIAGRDRGRAQPDRARGPGLHHRAGLGGAAAQEDPAADVRDSHPGGGGQPHHRP